MGPRAGLDRCGKSPPTGIRSQDRPTRSQSLYRLRHPVHKILEQSPLYAMKLVTASQVGDFVRVCTVLCNYNMMTEASDTTSLKKKRSGTKDRSCVYRSVLVDVCRTHCSGVNKCLKIYVKELHGCTVHQ